MGIWKININRNYCVIAYAMPTHSVHSPIPVKGIPEPPLEVVCLHASFLGNGFRLKTLIPEYMAKIRLLIVQSIEGYMVEDYAERYPSLREETAELMNDATFPMDENASLSMLIEGKRRKGNNATYFIEATPVTASIINGMLRMYLIDEIIAYTIPAMPGNGRRPYLPGLPKTDWECTSVKIRKDGTVQTILRKIG